MDNRYEQAIQGLEEGIAKTAQVVRVRDGVDTWVMTRWAWDAACVVLETMEVVAGDEGGADAYSALCDLARHHARIRGGLITNQGSDIGTESERAELAQLAVEADLLDPDEALAKRFAVEG